MDATRAELWCPRWQGAAGSPIPKRLLWAPWLCPGLWVPAGLREPGLLLQRGGFGARSDIPAAWLGLLS